MGWGSYSPERLMSRAQTAPGVNGGSILPQPPQGTRIRAALMNHPRHEGIHPSTAGTTTEIRISQGEKRELAVGKAAPCRSTQKRPGPTPRQCLISPRTLQPRQGLRGSRADPSSHLALGRTDEPFYSIICAGPHFCKSVGPGGFPSHPSQPHTSRL